MRPPLENGSSETMLPKDQLSEKEMKEWRDTRISEGWVEVHDSKVERVWNDMEASSRPRIVSTFEGFSIFAGSGKVNKISFSPGSKIAGFTLSEADCMCTMFLKQAFVILTKGGEEEPNQSFLIRFIDWTRLEKIRTKNAAPVPPEFFPTVKTFLARKKGVVEPSFEAGTIDTDTLLTFKCALVNVAPWLGGIWSAKGSKISIAEIALRKKVKEKNFFRTPETTYPLNLLEKRRLLHCHFFRHWESKSTGFNERGDDLRKCIPELEKMGREQANSDEVDAGCRNPPASLRKRLFAKHQNEAKKLIKEFKWTKDYIESNTLFWLFAVILPRTLGDRLAGLVKEP